MPVKEALLEDRVCLYANKLGVRTPKLRMATESGWPDRTLLYRGRVLFVEFKRLGEKPTPLQAYTHEALRQGGFTVYVIDECETGKDMIKNWIEHVDNELA